MQASLVLFECLLSLWIDQLGHTQFRKREQAHRVLTNFTILNSAETYVHRASVAAISRGSDSQVNEVSVRCRKLIAQLPGPDLWPIARTILPKGMTKHPWLYLGWEDEVTKAWIAHAHTLREIPYGSNQDDFEDYRVATLCWIRSQLLQHRSRTEILFDLEVMAVEERRWKRDNPGR